MRRRTRTARLREEQKMSYLPKILKERAENDRIRRESLTDEQFVRDDYGSNSFYGGEYDGVMSDLSGGDGSRDR